MENKPATPTGGLRDSIIVCRNSQGAQVRATSLRLTRHAVVFEVYNPYSIVQLSEVLSEFQIFIGDKLMYSGRAVVSNMLNAGIMLICEASLDEAWLDVDIFAPITQKDRLRKEFTEFIREWEKIYQVLPAFKVVVSDLQSFLVDLRRWMEQVELSVRSQPTGDRLATEREIIQELEEPAFPELVPLFQRFEQTCALINDELRPAHGSFAKRQLHPLLLCSPFMYRIYHKPLGYAGDYEMVNMILRDPFEGSSMFAKILNVYILKQAPAEAHRNRVRYLRERLVDETLRVSRTNQTCRVLNLGCGPAKEVIEFLNQDDISDRAQLTLLDFNDETLEFASRSLGEARARARRVTGLQFTKKSVHQLLKESSRTGAGDPPYDLIYCAGLFDYLGERICKRLMNHFYDILAPGGLLVATNVDACNPIRNIMEYIFEWHLVYRSQEELARLAPDQAPAGACRTLADPTGSNIFIEVRKPPPPA
jgi:extracellular factor (EF) 3-hydroxypalmitic acid methyl ester biosynthesis protein